MSEGPIKQWRDGFKVPRASTPKSKAVHASQGRYAAGVIGTLTYCGRRGPTTLLWTDVTCADCLAARRADGAA